MSVPRLRAIDSSHRSWSGQRQIDIGDTLHAAVRGGHGEIVNDFRERSICRGRRHLFPVLSRRRSAAPSMLLPERETRKWCSFFSLEAPINTRWTTTQRRSVDGVEVLLATERPADRAWRRRGYMVLCRAHTDMCSRGSGSPATHTLAWQGCWGCRRREVSGRSCAFCEAGVGA